MSYDMSYSVEVSHSCVIHKESTHRLSIGPGERAFSFKHRIRHAFKIKPAASFVFTYYNTYADPGMRRLVTIVRDEDLEEVMRGRPWVRFLRVKIDESRLMKYSCPIDQSLKWYSVYFRHLGHFRSMDLAPGEPEFTFEQLKSRIYSLFELPPFAHFLLKGTEKMPITQNNYEPRATYEITDAMNFMEALEKGLVIDLCIIDENHSRVIGDTSGCVTLKICHFSQIRLLTLTPSMMSDFSYEKFICRIRLLFTLSPSVQIELSYKNDDETITITTGEELKNALPWLGVVQRLLSVRTFIISEGDTSYALNCRYNGTVRLLTLLQSELEYVSYEKFLILVQDLFKLPHSTQLALTYEETSNNTYGNCITASTVQELKDLVERSSHLQGYLEVIVMTDTHVVKVRHNGTVRRLILCAGMQEFNYDKLHSRIRNLFKLPLSAQFSLSYLDKDKDIISMTEDDDLIDALILQDLNPLMLNIMIVEGLADVSMSPSAITGDQELTDNLTEWETV